MPTYVYKCDSCGAQFEQFQSFKEEALHTCPSCSGAVRRVFQPVGIVFKGSGWYITDSRKSGSATVSGGDDSSSKSEGSSTAPAAPTESAPSSASTTASSSASE